MAHGVLRSRFSAADEKGELVPILRIEHPVIDYQAWKASFDRFDDLRVQSRVRGYRLMRAVGDASYVMVDLEFDSADEAEAMLAILRNHWRDLQGIAFPENTTPNAQIAAVVDARQY